MKRRLYLFVVFAAFLAGTPANTGAETLRDRRCSSDAGDRSDPRAGSVARLYGPHSDLTERPGKFCGLYDDDLIRISRPPASRR